MRPRTVLVVHPEMLVAESITSALGGFPSIVPVRPATSAAEAEARAEQTAGLDAAAIEINARPAAEKSSKYVQDVTVAGGGTPWPLVVTISATAGNGIPTALDGQTIVFSPNVNGVAPVVTAQGAIDWACASQSAQSAVGRGLANAVLGTVPARYAPSECR